MRRAHLVASLIGLGLALATPAPGQDVGGPCAADVQRLCPDMKPGRKLRRCLQDHQPEFSPECKAYIEERENRRRVFQEACSEDIRTFCLDTSTGHGRIRRCLEANEKMLSPECRSALQQIPETP